ncbi:MAG: BPSL0067 family protein, partial [Chthoniobacter sp.]|uniref:BPSL0067 family protein n=1 Tax=Chthoniobacter sp. TaxID=2510640 RepID=UPI0032AB2182
FLIAQCKTKSGSVLGGALLRPLVWWWCAANFSADWLLKFAELFGIPKPKAGEATLADTKEEASMPPSEMDSSATGNSFPFLAWDADKHPRNAIGQFARTASDTTGSNGPRGNTTENIQKAHVDPGVKDMPVEKVKDHYRTFVKRSTEIYEQNKAFLENNLFSTAVGRPDTVAIDNHGDIKKTPKVDPAALKLWKQIFLDDGTTKTGEKEKNLGECVSLVSNLTGITPDRTKWRPGARVVDSDNIKPGTAIATFNDKGVYDPRDNPHAAIFISKGTNSEGRDYILILEQFNPGHKARHPQTRALFLAPEPSDPSKRDYSNCSNYFHVIETT